MERFFEVLDDFRMRWILAWEILKGASIVCHDNKRKVVAAIVSRGTIQTRGYDIGLYDTDWIYEKNGKLYIKEPEKEED